MIEIKQLNKVLSELSDIEPLVEFSEPMNEISHEMNYALAQMFASKGFRNYLEMAINSQIKSLLKTETTNDIFFIKGRILTLKELLIISKRAFENVSKVEKAKR